MSRKRKDLSGNVYDKLTVLSYSHSNKYNQSMWLCKCDCGNTTVARSHSLTSGRLHSCGCYNVESHTKHNASETKEYYTWNRLKDRCLNTNNKDYVNYGGRGITIDQSWIDSFECFLQDVGKAPSEYYSLDRINNNKGYTKDNVRWATSTIQNNNKRNTKVITYMNKTKTLSEWAKELNVPRHRLYQRIYKYGWSISEAFSLPADLGNKYKRGVN